MSARDFSEHTFTMGREGEYVEWRVPDLWALAEALPVVKVRVDLLLYAGGAFGTSEWLDAEYLHEERDRIEEADLAYPVLLGPDHTLMDGYHRVAKSALLGLPEIPAVVFPDWPPGGRVVAPGEYSPASV